MVVLRIHFMFLSLFLLALSVHGSWPGKGEAASPSQCSEVPHRVRYKCYASQVQQGASGARTRGRVLKEGLPPVFDYEMDQADNDKTSKEQASGEKQAKLDDTGASKNAKDAIPDADSDPNLKQVMNAEGMETHHAREAAMPETEKDWIVVWDESQVSLEDIRRVCESGLAGTNKTCQREYSMAVTGFSARLTLSELEGVLSEHSARIKYAERDQVFSAAMMNQTTNLPWGLDRIDSRNGRSGAYNYLYTGEGVNIYVLDSGVRVTHEQFGYLNGSDGSRAQSGYDFIDKDFSADDCTGHGTHVAGMAAGRDVGVAKDSRVYSVRVLDCYGSGSTQAVVAGIDWTETNHIKPAVATISLTGPASVTLDEATAALVAAGVTVTVPAGNGGWNACYNSPAREAAAITVGASDEYNRGTTYTNYGTCVDLFAPGANVLSADYGSDASLSIQSGTSVASPYVAGVAALYLQVHPAATPADVKSEVLNDATTNVLSNIGIGSPNKLLYSFAFPITSSPTAPTTAPSSVPTSPTAMPTTTPTASPTAVSTSPTAAPTTPPTASPTGTLTMTPSASPTGVSTSPTSSPTAAPTAPTTAPSAAPTSPTGTPTSAPTSPTVSPTLTPTSPTGSPTSEAPTTTSPSTTPPTTTPPTTRSPTTRSPSLTPSTRSPTLTPTSSSPTSYAPTGIDRMPDVVSSFVGFAPSITNGLYSMYSFSDGLSGSCIQNGGNNMYNCGNEIYVKAVGSSGYVGPLPYRQSTSSTVTLAGDITYTTYKSTTEGRTIWLAMFHSLTAAIDGFKVDGTNYASGSRYVNSGALGASAVDPRFSGWYKCVYGYNSPSINHLIIATGSSWTQAASSNARSDQHALTRGSAAGSRLFYLMWAGYGSSGTYGRSYGSYQFTMVMNAFLRAIETTVSPTSPTTPPTAAPTPRSVSPTVVTASSCAEYLYAGHTTSGVYRIRAKAGSGLPDRSVYCDMEEDGGGWMLLYSYNRKGSVTHDRPLDGLHIPTSPTTGYSHWHLGPALGYTSADDVLDVRFHCKASYHSRVVHFKTSNHHIREVAVSGSFGNGNSPSHWNTGWTALTNHSAYLPAATTIASSSGGFDGYSFGGNHVQWAIPSSYYFSHCDDWDLYIDVTSHHHVWVRLAGPTRAPTSAPTSPTTTPTAAPTSPTTSPTGAPTSPTGSPTAAPTPRSTSPTTLIPTTCAEYMYLGHVFSGVYTLRAKAGSGLPDRSVYCDMEEDGGGWMLLYSYNRNVCIECTCLRIW
eukprot:CAMPEP_0114250174 /NCGR_PEP_ID=MMETSP0058-20121206/14555_1 /TAXON_ID=36894 /ORGANISM="Pyramimonas parkeae, CCMP726" /LENGTH=1253 /DNA_ID=CAMNT_0001363809 /DNA_START=190 /DNA_END=3948 /DNA_ORIENTATION=-